MTAPAQVALCIGCECTDVEACPGGCSWLYVNYEIGYGICSSCPDAYEEFQERGPENALAEMLPVYDPGDPIDASMAPPDEDSRS